MIHPTSIISKEAEVDSGVEIGPYSIIKGRVRIGKGTKLENNVTIGSEYGLVEIGENNTIYAGAVLGGAPQDKKYKGENTKLTIGNNNHIREFVTLNIGTVTGGGATDIGDNNLIMAYVHFGHDCKMGNNNVIANSCQLAGHVIIENNVTLGGMCAVNQFCTLGNFSFIGGFSAINKDILPYCIAQGNYAIARATNKVGLERNGFLADEIEDIHKALRIILKGEGTIQESVARVEQECRKSDKLTYFLDFIKNSKRGIAI